MSLTEIGGRGEFFRAVGRQEHVVEREASCGIKKLRVDGGRAIDVGEELVAAGTGTERAGARIFRVMSCF